MADGMLDNGGAPIQLPVVHPVRNSMLQRQSTDQEMQWLPESGRSVIQTQLPAPKPFFLEPCEMGRDTHGRVCEELCKAPPEELCEAMYEDPPREPCKMACVELCEDAPAWDPCRDSLTGQCEGLCEEMCKDPSPQKPCEGSSGSAMQAKAQLPSIVVEPTEVGEVESGELRWPPDEFLLLEGEDELFTEEEEQAAGPGSESSNTGLSRSKLDTWQLYRDPCSGEHAG